jgi:hypothetical protein
MPSSEVPVNMNQSIVTPDDGMISRNNYLDSQVSLLYLF